MSDSENQRNDAPNPHLSSWALWERYTSGEELTRQQSESLTESLKSDEEFRHNVLAERAVDQMLRMEAERPDQSEAFVARVLAKVNSLETNHGLSNSSLQSPIGKLLDPTQLENINKDRQITRNEESFLLRPRGAWLSIAALVLVSVTGVGFWYRHMLRERGSNRPTDLAEAPKGSESAAEPAQQQPFQASQLESVVDKEKAKTIQTNEPTLEPTLKPMDRDSNVVAETQQTALATVTKAERIERDSKIANGLSLGKEIIDVAQGEFEFTTASGAKVSAFAPCRLELITENEIRLITGELSVEISNPASHFQLTTPAIAVNNTESVFDIVVDQSGRTEVEVRRGGIAIEAIAFPTAQAWKLNAESINSLVVYTPVQNSHGSIAGTSESMLAQAARGPVASIARSFSGESIGVITYNGQSRSFDDELVFSKVREQVFKGAQQHGESFATNWSRFVETATNEPQPAGSIELNGKEFAFGNYNEAVLAQNNVLAQFAPVVKSNDSNEQAENSDTPPSVNDQVPGSFRGTLFLRGQRRDFNSFAEYQAALKELMGPAAEFGFFPFGN